MIALAFPSWVSPLSRHSGLLGGLRGSPVLGLTDSYCCTVIDGRKKDCRSGKTCTSGGRGCVNSGYISCPGGSFCCRTCPCPHPLFIHHFLHSRSSSFPSFVVAVEYTYYREAPAILGVAPTPPPEPPQSVPWPWLPRVYDSTSIPDGGDCDEDGDSGDGLAGHSDSGSTGRTASI
jgi:hypothetical protein